MRLNAGLGVRFQTSISVYVSYNSWPYSLNFQICLRVRILFSRSKENLFYPIFHRIASINSMVPVDIKMPIETLTNRMYIILIGLFKIHGTASDSQFRYQAVLKVFPRLNLQKRQGTFGTHFEDV